MYSCIMWDEQQERAYTVALEADHAIIYRSADGSEEIYLKVYSMWTFELEGKFKGKQLQ